MSTDIVTNSSGNANLAGSLGYEVAHASNGDTITFVGGLAGATIDLASTLIITKNIAIEGLTGGQNITLNGGNAFTDIFVGAGVTASLDGLDIINGAATGAAGGRSFVVQGGDYFYFYAGNAAAGGIYDAGTLTISNSTLTADSGTGGKGGYGPASYSYIGGGAGGSAAGGIYVANGGSLTIDVPTVTFSDNAAAGGAGGAGAKNGYSPPSYAGGSGGLGGSQMSGGSAIAPGSGSHAGGPAGGAGGAGGHHGGSGHSYFQGNETRFSAGGGGGGGYAFADYGGKGTITPVCFRAGTRLLTPRGMVAVESLQAGDSVAAGLGHGAAAVRWVGHMAIDATRHPRPHEVWPIRIAADAFADGLPARDLYLSPGHAVHVPDAGGALIPIRLLVNGATIAQHPVPQIRYFHVELAAHDVLFAEGLPAESYLDDGNRSAFANGGGAARLHPDLAAAVWNERACAPLLLDDPLILAVRARLLARAGALGWTGSDFAALRVTTGDRTLVQRLDAATVSVAPPPGTAEVRVRTRRAVPPHLDDLRLDSRALGVLVTAIALDYVAVPLDDPRLAAGWHAPEPGGRWTEGDAVLRCAGATSLRLHLTAAPRYWIAPFAADRPAVRSA